MSLLERINAAGELIDALEDLPPTYEMEKDLDIAQVIPDPVSLDNLEAKLDRVERAEKENDRLNNKK
jgi:hypothetical protein